MGYPRFAKQSSRTSYLLRRQGDRDRTRVSRSITRRSPANSIELPRFEIIFSAASSGRMRLVTSARRRMPSNWISQAILHVALFLAVGRHDRDAETYPGYSRADYLYNARDPRWVSELTNESRIWCGLPAEHNFLSLVRTLGALLVGARAVFCQSTKPPTLRNNKPRNGSLIALRPSDSDWPARSSCLRTAKLDHCSDHRRRTTAPGATHASLKRAFPHLAVQQVPGMAEGLLCYTRLDDQENVTFYNTRPRASPQTNTDVDSGRTDAAPDKVGELWCRGLNTIRGTSGAGTQPRSIPSPDGFYRTGDLVRLTVGKSRGRRRIKDLIQSRRRENQRPRKSKHNLIAHPASKLPRVAMPDAMLARKHASI